VDGAAVEIARRAQVEILDAGRLARMPARFSRWASAALSMAECCRSTRMARRSSKGMAAISA
jgi:hypothetical protein